jgi:hypothetical protein
MREVIVILLLIAGTACALEGGDFAKMGALSDSGASHPGALTNEAKFMDALKSISPAETRSDPNAVSGTNETTLAINITGINASAVNTSAINESTNSSAINISATNTTVTNVTTTNVTTTNATATNATAINESLLNASSLNSLSLNASSLNASSDNESSLSDTSSVSAKGVSSEDKSTVKGFWSMAANKQSSMGSGVHSSTSLSGDFDVDKTVKISE